MGNGQPFYDAPCKHDVEGMVHLIAVAAKEGSIDLFQRYAVMRYWQLTEGMTFSAFLSPDELHLNDWSYGCVAKLLAGIPLCRVPRARRVSRDSLDAAR